MKEGVQVLASMVVVVVVLVLVAAAVVTATARDEEFKDKCCVCVALICFLARPASPSPCPSPPSTSSLPIAARFKLILALHLASISLKDPPFPLVTPAFKELFLAENVDAAADAANDGEAGPDVSTTLLSDGASG
jgi:hypothetical protein